MSERRKPGAFPVTPPESDPVAPVGQERQPPRRPRAAKPEQAMVVPADVDVFDADDEALATPPPAAPGRRSKLGSVLLAALGLLVSLAIGLWTDWLIRDLFARSDWLGWFAVAVASVAALALVVIVARELVGLARLASVERLRARVVAASASPDTRQAHALVRDLSGFLASQPATAAGRLAIRELDGEVIDAPDLLRLAETELLAPLDQRAQQLVLDAAKRVAMVTAVSPRALADIAYVLFEAARLIRALAELYGGRPGTLGLLRIARDVLAHLAVTGAIAATDEFVHQIVGQGLAARLSAKLGEGVVNGMMTARIGIAAIETVRPMPFSAVKRPGLGDFLSALTSFVRRKAPADGKTAS